MPVPTDIGAPTSPGYFSPSSLPPPSVTGAVSPASLPRGIVRAAPASPTYLPQPQRQRTQWGYPGIMC
eukprot:2450121-Amphidinium_carterae.1